MSYTINKGIKRVDGCEDFELCGVDSIGCTANVSVSFNDNNEILKVKVVNLPKADNQESSEWPQVGDEVHTRVGIGVVKLTSDKFGHYIVDIDDVFCFMSIGHLKKPKTPEEELRDDIAKDIKFDIECQSTSDERVFKAIANNLMIKYEIKPRQ